MCLIKYTVSRKKNRLKNNFTVETKPTLWNLIVTIIPRFIEPMFFVNFRVESYTQENSDLKRKVDSLENNNR